MGRKRNIEWEEVIENKVLKNWQCRHCSKDYTGASYRIKAHILQIPGQGIGPCDAECPDNVIMKLGGDPATVRAIKKARMEAGGLTVSRGAGPSNESITSSPTFPHTTATHTSTGPSSSLPPSGRQTLQRGWAKAKDEIARRRVRQYFFECNVPFEHARKPAFLNMLSAVADAGPSFKPLSSETLRTTELRAEVKDIDRELQPIRAAWGKYGCTIICDGWTDTKHRPLINVMVSSCLGATFLTSIDGSSASHTAEYLYGHMKAAIEEVGSEKVVAVVTDNATNCKAAGALVERDYAHISWVPCASHSIDLLIEDVGDIPWVNKVVKKAEFLVNFVMRKQRALGIYRANCEVELAKPSSTRFAYIFLVLEKLVKCRRGLRRMITDDMWLQWEGSTTPKAKRFEDIIYEGVFWHHAESIIGFMEPLIIALRLSDSEGCTMGLIYEFMDKVGEAFTKCTLFDDNRYIS